jgi:uncharacterized protein
MRAPLNAVVEFVRALRASGVQASPGQLLQFVRALDNISITERAHVRDVARTTLVSSREDLVIFEDLFDRFWDQTGMASKPPPTVPPALPKTRLQPAEIAIAQRLGKHGEQRAEQAVVDRSMTWSPLEVVRRKRFDELSEEEASIVRGLMQKAHWQFGERTTRRFRRASARAAPDWRRMIRRAVRNDGELLERKWRVHESRPRPIVALADISGSMERYSRMLLAFLHALVQQGRRRPRPQPVEVFVFGTRLTRITRALEARSFEGAMEDLGHDALDWAGGTRIGECLHRFNRAWGRRVLGRGAVVLVISDGWDQGDPALVAHEMDRLRKSCHRLVWVNPLVGTPGYEPKTRGMLAALPSLDEFRGGGTLQDLFAMAG